MSATALVLSLAVTLRSNRRLFALFVSLVGCDLTGVYYVNARLTDYSVVGFGGLPRAYQLGDTVTFLAEESYAQGSRGSPAGPSSTSPEKYSWQSTDGSVAQMIAPGRVRFRSLGRAFVSVRSGRASTEFEVNVVPRVAAVRITPVAAVIRVGDTVSFQVTGLDSTGRVIPEINRLNKTAVILQPDLPANSSNPIAASIETQDVTRYLYGSWRPGVVTLIGMMPIYRVSSLRATALLEVR